MSVLYPLRGKEVFTDRANWENHDLCLAMLVQIHSDVWTGQNKFDISVKIHRYLYRTYYIWWRTKKSEKTLMFAQPVALYAVATYPVLAEVIRSCYYLLLRAKTTRSDNSSYVCRAITIRSDNGPSMTKAITVPVTIRSGNGFEVPRAISIRKRKRFSTRMKHYAITRKRNLALSL